MTAPSVQQPVFLPSMQQPQKPPQPSTSPIGTPGMFKNQSTPTYMGSAAFAPPGTSGGKTLLGQ